MKTQYFKMALQMLRSNPFFSTLSILAISVTVMIVLIMSMQYEMVIAPGEPELNLDRTLFLKRGTIKHSDESGSGIHNSLLGSDLVEHLRGELTLPEAISQATSASWNFVSASGVVECSLVYTDTQFWQINRFNFLSGRPFSQDEVEQGAEVVVLSHSIAQKQFGEVEAVGRTLEILGKPFQVIGVVGDVSSLRRYSFGDLWIPYTQNTRSSAKPYLGEYIVMLMGKDKKDIPKIKQEVKTTISNLALTLPKTQELIIPGPDTSFEDYFRGWQDSGDVGFASSWLQIFLRIVGVIMVPALNLIAINLTWISERAREIGLRKAFGATNQTIIKQLMSENMLITLIGGIIGLIMTMVVTNTFSQLLFRGAWEEQANFIDITFSILPFLITLGSVFILSLLSGLLPAIRISRTEPARVLKGGAI